MKIPSIDKLADTKRIRKAALAIVKAKTFKEGYSYSVTQGRLQGQYTCIRPMCDRLSVLGSGHIIRPANAVTDGLDVNLDAHRCQAYLRKIRKQI
jgi:hypothetical protein